MKTKLIPILLFIFSAFRIHSQVVTFQMTIDGPDEDGANYVQPTSDNGFIIVGFVTNMIVGAKQDAFLIKTDSLGNILWNKTYGDTNIQIATCVQQTDDGGFIVAGYSSDNSSSIHGFLIKTNSNGDTTWTKTYGTSDCRFYSVKQTIDGGFIAAGTQNTTGIDGAFLVRVDNLGNVSWIKKYGGTTLTDYVKILSIDQTIDGGFIAGGRSDLTATQICLLRLDSLGDTLWTKGYNSFSKYANCVQQTSDGGYITGGYFDNGSAGGKGACYLKTDGNGNIIWQKKYSISSYVVNFIQQTAEGNYISALTSFGASLDISYLVQLNASGIVSWGKSFQPTMNNELFCVQQIASSGYVMAGYIQTDSTTTSKEIYLIKTDSLGKSGCSEASSALFTTNINVLVTNLSYPINNDTTGTGFLAFPVNNPSVSTNYFCTNVGIKNETPFEVAVSVYPNPGIGLFEIKSASIISNVEIYNSLGENIYSHYLSTEIAEIDLQNQPSGIYFLRIVTANGTLTKKMMIE